MKTKILSVVAMVFIVLTGAGCGNNSANNSPTPANPPADQQTPGANGGNNSTATNNPPAPNQ